MANRFCLCQTCETEFSFPALDADQNCPGSPSLSQVSGLLLLPTGASLPSDWTSKEDWEDVIDNDDTSNSLGKYLTGVGLVGVPEKTTFVIAKGVTMTSIRNYALTLEVYNLSDVQYEALRAFQCGPTNYSLWIETISGYLFGGEDGISPYLTDVDFPLGGGEGDAMKAVLTVQWRASCDPPRALIENLSENFAGMTSTSRVLGFSTTQVFGNTTSQVHGY